MSVKHELLAELDTFGDGVEMPLPLPQALFLDRDGTLIEWVDYLCKPEKVVLVEGTKRALALAKASGCRLFLHTNQSGVGRGYFGMEAVEAVNARMLELMGVDATFFDGVCIATDHPDTVGEGSYRKPSPRYELEMVARHQLSPERCFMIGDSPSDLLTGKNAGIVPVLVRSEQTKVDELPVGTVEYESVASFVAAHF